MASHTVVDFTKYQGTGNDFIMIDNRDGRFDELSDNQRFTQWLCDRHFGVGGDGIQELRARPGYDFEMVYTREEGVKGPYLCGNGSRCIVAFAHDLGVPQSEPGKYHFLARDGPHDGWVEDATKDVHVRFKDVEAIKKYDAENFYIDVGNERHVAVVDDVWVIDVIKEGKRLGYDARYMDERQGMNVMFIQETGRNQLNARGFDCKIDYEPLACGTGAVASALVDDFRRPWVEERRNVHTEVNNKGGKVSIKFDRLGEMQYGNIYLIGPAKKIFTGQVRFEDFLACPEYKYQKRG